MYILLFIFLLIIVVIVIGLTLVGAVLRSIFGLGRRSSNSGNTSQQQTYGSRANQQTYQSNQDNSSYNNANEEEKISDGSKQRHKKKLFTKEDGEYVDFEEIKEDK